MLSIHKYVRRKQTSRKYMETLAPVTLGGWLGILLVQPCASSLVTSRCLGERSKVPSQNVRTGKGAVVRTQLLQTSGKEGEKGDTLLRCLGGFHRGNRSSPPGETDASCTEPLTCLELTSISLSLSLSFASPSFFCFVLFLGISLGSFLHQILFLIVTWFGAHLHSQSSTSWAGSFSTLPFQLPVIWVSPSCLHLPAILGVFLSCSCYVSAL